MAEKRIEVESIVSHRNKQPYVQLTVGSEMLQLTIPKAREIAYWLLRATTSVEADACLVAFLNEKVGLAPSQQGVLLQDFRQYRKSNAVTQAKED